MVNSNRLDIDAGCNPGRTLCDTARDHASLGHSARAVERRLRKAGLRATRPRVLLAGLLFHNGHRHVTAEVLHAEARQASVIVSLATVYNTLHQFTEAGLLAQFAANGRRYFDTNLSHHHHYVVEGDGTVFDMPMDVDIAAMPPLPEGFEFVRCEIVVRLRRKKPGRAAAP